MLILTAFSTISGSLGTSGMSISGRGGSSRTEDKLSGGGDAGGVTATCGVTLGDGRRGGLWEIINLHILKLLVINSRMREYVYLWRILLPDISCAQPEKLILYKTSIHNFIKHYIKQYLMILMCSPRFTLPIMQVLLTNIHSFCITLTETLSCYTFSILLPPSSFFLSSVSLVISLPFSPLYCSFLVLSTCLLSANYL